MMKNVNLFKLVESLSGAKMFCREIKNSNEVVAVLRELYGNAVTILVGVVPPCGTLLFSKELIKGTKACAAGKDSQGNWFYVYE